ncbi:thioredoxin family protein [Bacillus sp. AP8]|nr:MULTISPECIES: thioredoxin family protein [Bacillus]
MMVWNGEEIQKKIENQDSFCLYLFTPICGTCQVASRMLMVIKEIVPNIQIGKTDVNYIRKLAEDYKVESVPCLLIFKKGQIIKKIYAFQSVPYLLEVLNENFQ